MERVLTAKTSRPVSFRFFFPSRPRGRLPELIAPGVGAERVVRDGRLRRCVSHGTPASGERGEITSLRASTCQAGNRIQRLQFAVQVMWQVARELHMGGRNLEGDQVSSESCTVQETQA